WLGAAQFLHRQFYEMPCQNRDVFRPLLQTGDLDRKHIKPVVDVFTKVTYGHFVLQVTISRADNPHIRKPRSVLAHTFVTLLLQDTEKFTLHIQRNFSDFIEKKSPAFSSLETPGAVLDRSSKCALRVAKEFAFVQV